MDLVSDSERSMASGLFNSGVEDVDLPKTRDWAAVAYCVGLRRLPFAVVGRAVKLVRVGSAQSVAGAPEIRRSRLVCDIPQHLAELAVFDFPEGLAAELEIVTLLIDRPTSVAID